jgi:hypothetical protein
LSHIIARNGRPSIVLFQLVFPICYICRMKRFYTKTIPEPNSGCVLWTASTFPNGYGQFHIPQEWGYSRTRMQAHRVAWILERGDPGNLLVCHRCDNKLCVNVDHLYLGTYSDNLRDSYIRGPRRGSLSASDVASIRDSTLQTKLLTEKFGINRSTVQRIRNGTTWKTIG